MLAHPRSVRVLGSLAGAVIVATVLTACVAEPEPAPSSSRPSVAPSASPTSEPASPELVPDGTAEENLAFFQSIVDGVWAAGQPLEGRAYIDALVGGGFDKAAMQVTNDQTSLGGEVDTIQFSVLWGEECLIGQIGPSTGDPVSVVMPRVRGGACLVGQTRTIDW